MLQANRYADELESSLRIPGLLARSQWIMDLSAEQRKEVLDGISPKTLLSEMRSTAIVTLGRSARCGFSEGAGYWLRIQPLRTNSDELC